VLGGYNVDLIDLIRTHRPNLRHVVRSCETIRLVSAAVPGTDYQVAPVAATFEEMLARADAGARFRVIAKVVGNDWPAPLPSGDCILLEMFCQEFICVEGSSWRQLLVANLGQLCRHPRFPIPPCNCHSAVDDHQVTL